MSGRDEPEAGAAVPLVRVSAKLRTILGALAGTAGVNALLARALTLARTQDASLAVVQVHDGALSGADELYATEGGPAAAEVVLAQLFDLLTILIGSALLLQLLRGEWPDVPASWPGNGGT